MNKTVQKVINFYGGAQATQERFGYTTTEAIYQWKARGIPRKLALIIHEETKIPLKELLSRTV